MGTLPGEATVISIVASRVNWGLLIKERICSYQSKFFPLRVDPILGGLHPSDKQEVTKIVSL